jgi:outer membrane protein TolC
LVPVLPDTVQLLERALALRPELLVARAALDLGKAEATLANSRLLPEADVGVFGGQDDGDDVSGLRVGLSVPFLGPPLSERGARAAERRRLEAELRAAIRDAQAQVAAARDAAALAYRQVSLFQQEILPGIQEARQRYQEAYDIGEVDLTTVLLSDQRFRDAERTFAETLATYLEALRALETATGVPLLSGYALSEEVKS